MMRSNLGLPAPTDVADLAHLDLADPVFRADPYPTYARLRREAPVVRNDAMGYWLITRYDDVAAGFRNPRLFSSDSFDDRPVSLHDPANGAHAALLRAFGNTMIFMDPPQHTRLRKLVNKAFTPGQIKRLRDRLTGLCRSLLLAGRETDDFDFVRDFAAPFPILVIAELLGVPVHDRDLVKDLSYQFGILFEPMLPLPERATALDKSVELGLYLDAAAEDRRRKAGEDLISALVAAQDGKDRLTADELQGMLLHLLVAGNETSTSLISHTQLIFDEMPHLRAEIAAQPERVVAFVDEVLRFNPPLQLVTRQVTEDVDLHGVTIPKGDLVGLVIGAANRDENVFDHPDEFDLDRPTNKRYLSFGGGAHFCLGANLSRLEGEIAAGMLADEFADLRVDPARGVRRPDQMIRGYLSLPGRFTGPA